MTHTVALLTKALLAHRALKRFRVVVYPEVVLEMAHLFEHFFAIVDAANEELTSPHCAVIGCLNVKVLRERVDRFNSVVGKQRYDSFQSN